MPSIHVYDGSNTLTVELDLDSSVADLFEGVAAAYDLPLEPRKHLRIIFADTAELKFSTKSRLSNSGLVNHSTVGVVFRLPDRKPPQQPLERCRQAPDPTKPRKKGRKDKKKITETESKLTEETRPQLQPLRGVIPLTHVMDFLDNPDFLLPKVADFKLYAIMPKCRHVMGSEATRMQCATELDKGHFKIVCPYRINNIFLQLVCPVEWDYRHVRHVACFTKEEMQETERNIIRNLVGKESNVIPCPGCFTWSTRIDPNVGRLMCFICSKRSGREFFFCVDCSSREWKNDYGSCCGNPECKSIDAILNILFNSPLRTDGIGRTWPTTRLCPRCGLLTVFERGCSQMNCSSCCYFFCFICLKGAKSKRELKCLPYNSMCQISSPQTVIPIWDPRKDDD